MVRFRKITTAFQWFNASCCGLWLTVTIGLQCRTIRNMRSAGIHPGACAGSIGRRKNLPQVRKDLRSMPLIDALRTVLTVGGASQPLDLQLHQALGAEANHSPATNRCQSSSISRSRSLGRRNQTRPMICDDLRKPLGHCRTIGGALARRLGRLESHHQLGRLFEAYDGVRAI